MPTDNSATTRRDFLKTSTAIAAGATLASTLVVPRAVHAGSSEKMRIGLIGCGGRGTGAAENALNASPENVLVAVGGGFSDFAETCLAGLKRKPIKDRVQVPKENVFIGFDAYKQVID